MELKWPYFLWTLGTLFSLFVFTEALKCRTQNDSKSLEQFEDVVRECLNKEDEEPSYNRKGFNFNGNGNRRWGSGNDRRNNKSNRGRYGNDDEDEYGSDYNSKRGSRNNQRKRTGMGGMYGKEEDDYDDFDESSKGRGRDRGRYSRALKLGNYGGRNNNSSRNGKIGSPLEDIEACIVHCMFRQMKMLDEESYPEKDMVTDVLTERIKDSELKEFIEDSVNECFEEIESGNINGKCEFSKNLAMCLEKKGKMNCEDWEANSKSNNQHNNGNNRKKDPYNPPSRG